jgi:hypothetical protein
MIIFSDLYGLVEHEIRIVVFLGNRKLDFSTVEILDPVKTWR